MTRCIHDRVKETSTSTGLDTFTLLGAVSQFVSFSSRFELDIDFYYVIVGQTGTEWESGWGHLINSTTLVRVRVDESSNGDTHVNFSAGTKDVFNTAPAHLIKSHASKGFALALATGMAMP